MRAELLDHMGDDLSVVNAARVSFAKESDWETLCPCGSTQPCYTSYCRMDEVLSVKDQRLIHYLAKHNHWTPFAHTAIKLRVSAPVPIRTQCFKHKAGFVENEESRRYIKSTPELYIPDHFRLAPEGNVKQGSGDIHPDTKAIRLAYQKKCYQMVDFYEELIQDGVCPEQARFVLPQGVEVTWIWTGNLAAFARFYNQRTDPHAQQEVRELAEAIGKLIEPLFPVSWRALTDHD